MVESARFSRLLAVAERRLPALTRLKKPEPLPVELRRQRLYVLPTGTGIFFAALLAGMTLGALNYNNNPALLLSFIIASAIHSSLLQGYFNLLGLRVTAVDADPVHAGQTMMLRVQLENDTTRGRHDVSIRVGTSGTVCSPAAGQRLGLQVPMVAVRRGNQRCERIAVFTRYPLGLFRVWSWISPDRQLIVYPAIEASGPPLPHPSTEGNRRWRRSPGEQMHSLRDYRIGDPIRLMAWKRTAQTGRPLVREFEAPTGGQILLDWQAVTGVDDETRISRLTRWLIEAESLGLKTQLLLPGGSSFGPDQGEKHRRNCLTALALLPTSESRPAVATRPNSG